MTGSKWPWLTALAAVLLIVGAGWWLQRGDEPLPSAPMPAGEPKPAAGPTDFTAAKQLADENVARKRALLEAAPNQWLKQEILALALMDRFRLAGEWRDLVEARDLLDRAMELAPDPAGPNLTRASLALTEHDLDRAERALDRFDRTVVQSIEAQSQATLMRGDIAFQRGQRKDAAELYVRSDGLVPHLGSKLRLAELKLTSGNPLAAREITERIFRANPPVPEEFARSALTLANQSYAAGDTDQAGIWIARARAAFSGFWLAEAYHAQQMAVDGDLAGAVTMLEALAESSNEPEVIDALTGILGEMGEEDRATVWSARAGKLWEERLALSPASYRLHAAEHFLDFGDPARALELAESEVRERPTGIGVEVMASALIANGRPEEAIEWLDRAHDTGWRMTSLSLARANALEAMGQADAAEKVREEAAMGASLAGDQRRPLIRFGHY